MVRSRKNSANRRKINSSVTPASGGSSRASGSTSPVRRGATSAGPRRARRGHLVTKVYQPERGPPPLFFFAAPFRDPVRTPCLRPRGDNGAGGDGERGQGRPARVRTRNLRRQLRPAGARAPPTHAWRRSPWRAESVEAGGGTRQPYMLRVQKRRALRRLADRIAETADAPDVIEQTTIPMPRHVVELAIARDIGDMVWDRVRVARLCRRACTAAWRRRRRWRVLLSSCMACGSAGRQKYFNRQQISAAAS